MNLAAIHIRAKEAGLDDAAYRDLLLRVAGVRSAKELDEDQYLAVMRETLKTHGAARRVKSHLPSPKYGLSGMRSKATCRRRSRPPHI